ERHEERVVEAAILGVEEIEAALDPLLHDRSGQRLVNRKAIVVGAERPGALGADVDGQCRHGIEEEGLAVIAGDHGERVGPQRAELLPDAGEGGVNAKHEIAVFRLRSRDELRRVGQGEGPDDHQARPRPAAASTGRGMISRAAITGRGDVPIRSSPTTERSMYASRGSRPVRATTNSTAPRAQSSVAASIV